LERVMAICSECESLLDIDVDEVDEGDVVICDECGVEFEVVATEPLELSKIDNEGYELEDVSVRDEDEE
jgi:alpha-aminoadipate carrier protein LysW